MKNKFKYLAKNVLLFALSNFVPKILTFLLIKVYTEKLSTADYGLSDLLTTTASLLIPIFTIDIQDAVLRFSMDDDYNKKDVFTTAIKINLYGLLSIVIISIFLNFFQIFNVNSYFYLFLVIYYFAGALQNSIILFCKGIDKIKTIVVGSIISTLTTIVANILFLIVFDFGIYGFLIANVLGIIFYDVYIIFKEKLYIYINNKLNKNTMFEMIKYSFPLVFNSVSWWVNNASDRYILTFISGISASGIYAISYKIPNILAVFQSIFYQAWSISAIKEFDKNDTDCFIGTIYTALSFLIVFLCSLLIILNIPLSTFLYSNDFFTAWKFIPPLLVSVVFNSLALFIGGLLTAVKDTKTISFSTIIGAIVNTILNFLLIIFYGAYGAAIATLLGYFSVFLIRMIVLKKHMIMRFDKRVTFFTYFLVFVQMVVAYYGNLFLILQFIIMLIMLIINYKYIMYIIIFLKKMIKSHLENN